MKKKGYNMSHIYLWGIFLIATLLCVWAMTISGSAKIFFETRSLYLSIVLFSLGLYMVIAYGIDIFKHLFK